MRTLYIRKHIRALTKKADSTIYRWERAGWFPRRVQIGPRSVAWYADEVDSWIASRPTVAPAVERGTGNDGAPKVGRTRQLAAGTTNAPAGVVSAGGARRASQASTAPTVVKRSPTK